MRSQDQDRDLDRVLDRALDDIRDQSPDAEIAGSAVDRVWCRLQESVPAPEAAAQRIESCADFQALLPRYLSGQLQGARRLLLHDHLGECVTCRRAFKQMRAPVAGARPAVSRKAGSSWLTTMGWRVAAAAAIFIAVVGVSFETDVFSFETGGLVRVRAVQGELFRVTKDGTVPLSEGDEVTLKKGEAVRTAKDSTAVLSLGDDSAVEMRERSQFDVRDRHHLVPGRRNDGVIGLERGSIIVEASDQGSGHLYVDTEDCEVAVTGTVFSVNHGVKGSRVSVIEGEVHVAHGGRNDVLYPGDQTTTHVSLTKVPLDQEIAWSHKSHEYIALLREMRVLGRELDELFRPELRYSSDLLDLVPASTTIYLGLPNVSEELGRAFEILQARVADNEVLRRWWTEEFVQNGAAQTLEDLVEKVRGYGDHLGPEVLITVQILSSEAGSGPLLLARVTDREALAALVQDDLRRIDANDLPDVAVITGDLPPDAPPADNGDGAHTFIWLRQDLLAISANFRQLQELDAVLNGTGASLAGGAFHQQLAERYDQGVEWLVAIDLQSIIAGQADGTNRSTLESLGLHEVRHVIAERKQQTGSTVNRAVLTFAQPRQRLASWLGEPGPMGTMDYISPDANLAVAFVLKDASELVEELFAMIQQADPNFEGNLAEFEREAGIDIRQHVAAPLGGEFAMALDGPVLPTPSWKMIVEVYDPVRLQQTLEWLVEQVNRKAAQSMIPIQGLRLESTEEGGHEYFRIQSLDIGLSVHYVFDDGYMIAGPSRALLERALQSKALGLNLTDAPSFVHLLPQDGRVNFSGVFYHNLAGVLDPLSSALSTTASIADLDVDDQQILAALAAEAKPALVLVYGETDRIELFSTSEGGLLSSSLSQLTGFSGLLSMQQSLVRALEGGTRGNSL